MKVFLQIVAFSLQTDGSGRPVLTKGKRHCSPRINVKNMIRPREITLPLLLKLTVVKSGKTSNSFGLQDRFYVEPR